MSESLDEFAPAGPRLTDQLIYLKGRYNIGEAALPYFSVSVTVDDAVSMLKLARDIVFEPKEPIRLTELFQRDINFERVEDEIVPYLERPQHLKFFNSLTVVLLPVDPQKKVVLDRYPEPDPALVAGGSQTVGGIQVTPSKNNPQIGHIRWNRDTIYPVIVDGQHRFSALKEAYEDDDFPWRTGLRETQLPVLLILPHEDVGYKLPAGSQSLTVLQACRSIFIDLNKHAVAVPPARRYLLDDQDPAAVCMRAILSDGTAGATGGDVFARISSSKRLPLAVVNWVEGGPKFDNDEFLTSVITMYDLVRTTLGRDALSLGEDYDQNRSAIESLKVRLDLPNELADKLAESIDAAERDEVPFEYSLDDLASIGDQFRIGRGQFIWSTLSGFKPYSELLRKYAETGFLGGDLENWLILDKPGRRAVELARAGGSNGPKPSVAAAEIWGEIKKRWPIAYQVVFQKVLIRSVNNLFTVRASLASLWQEPNLADKDFAEFHALWLKRCNERLASQLGPVSASSVSLWDGTIVHGITKNMIFTESAQTAAEALIAYALIAPLDSWTPEESEKAAEKWVKDAWKQIARGKKESVEAAIYSQYGGPLRKSMQQAIVQRYKANEVEPPPSDKLESEAAKYLAQRLVLLIRPDATSGK